MYLDASPLTHLPGGIAIENVLKKRIASAHEIAFCLLDIDNFKAYNDRYGYARGSDLIRALGELIEREMQEHGSHSDFIGHVGGDDFVIISTPDNFTDICTSIIAGFDALVPDFYDPKDRERGYIRGKTRQGEEITFPLATLSIAVVTNTNRNITSHLQIGEIASELKEYAKSLPGSIYVVDHRRKPD
ncbi:MAG: GGDEF domain-containing protein [candidate division Zixibacteria bacterium]|nr:GGDEF domain-containing protein [candidate division Zixibacteria bacterium]